ASRYLLDKRPNEVTLACNDQVPSHHLSRVRFFPDPAMTSFWQKAAPRCKSRDVGGFQSMLQNLIRLRTATLAVLLLSATVLAWGGDSSAPSAKSEAASAAATNTSNAAPPAGLNPRGDPLVRLLVAKGVLSAVEANGLAMGPASEMHDRLLLLLKDKGVLSADDLNSLKIAVPIATDNLVTAVPAASTAADSDTQRTGAPQTPPTAQPSGPIPAVAPIRVLHVDPPKREGVVPTISIGKNVRIQPYGFVKVTAVYDSSSPYGNDF